MKWVWYESSPYTPSEEVGRRVYIREGCWYCHSQYVRPVAGEDLRWGPVSQVGEYAYDWPHLLSTRRIGPDLTRVGLKYGDDWHYAHHWVRGRGAGLDHAELPVALPDGRGSSWWRRTGRAAWPTTPRSGACSRDGPIGGSCLSPEPGGAGLLPPH